MQAELQFLQKEETRRSGLLMHLVEETVVLNKTSSVVQRHMQPLQEALGVVGHGQRSQLVLELLGKDSLVELALTEQITRGREVVEHRAPAQTPRQRLEATVATVLLILFQGLHRRIPMEVAVQHEVSLEAARVALVVVVLVTEPVREETQRITEVAGEVQATARARELLVATATRE